MIFQCPANHGIFTKLNRVFKEPISSPPISEAGGPTSMGSAAQTPMGNRMNSFSFATPSTERSPSPFGFKTPGGGGSLQLGNYNCHSILKLKLTYILLLNLLNFIIRRAGDCGDCNGFQSWDSSIFWSHGFC